eukprot:m.20635 g.20635  ORF g.20635 m.20635 type:complete len:437 (+) comp6908_c0_seq1:43-1353(+)
MASRSVLVALMLALVGAACARPTPTNMTRRVGSTKECVGGRVHNLKYDVTGPDEEVILDLDDIDHLENVECDIDHTRLKMRFSSDIYSAEYFVRFHDLNDHFLVGGAKWNCSVVDATRNGLIIRRVVGADIAGPYINLEAAEAQYDEIYEQANIAFSTGESCDADTFKKIDQSVCIGWNSQCKSTGATASIPLFSNNYINLACTNCFLDFHVDVFVEVIIQDFQVVKLQAGFKNMYINGSLEFTAKAESNWNVGVDKTLQIVPSQDLINFKVGPVPFLIYFEIPVEVKASLTFDAAAQLVVGNAVNIGLGDAYVSWNTTNHWSHVKPTPSVVFTPELQTSASLNAEAQMSVIPSFNAYFDKILSYSIVATPEIDGTIQGSEASKQICLKSTYDINVDSSAALNINIPWANIHDDKTWSHEIYDSGTQTIGQKCVPL